MNNTSAVENSNHMTGPFQDILVDGQATHLKNVVARRGQSLIQWVQ